MGRADFYDHGNPNMICDGCGQKYKKSEMQETWDHQWMCPFDFELRQPQDKLKSFPDNQSIEDPRPESVSDVTEWDGSALETVQNEPSLDEFLETNEVEAGDL